MNVFKVTIPDRVYIVLAKDEDDAVEFVKEEQFVEFENDPTIKEVVQLDKDGIGIMYEHLNKEVN